MKEKPRELLDDETESDLDRRVVVIIGAQLGLVGNTRPIPFIAEEYQVQKADNRAYYRQATEDWRGTQRRHQSRGRRR